MRARPSVAAMRVMRAQLRPFRTAGRRGRGGNRGVVARSQRTAMAVNTTFSNSAVKPVRVVHSEYLDTVPSPCALYAFDLNPGVADTFTWLSYQARLFEYYIVNAFSVRWSPSVAQTTAGSIYMAIDYDSRDAAPATISNMTNFTTFKMTPTREPMVLTGVPALMNAQVKQHAVRNGAVTASDIKTYDFGKLLIYVEGDTLAAAGTLLVSYDITFLSPTINEDDGMMEFPGTESQITTGYDTAQFPFPLQDLVAQGINTPYIARIFANTVAQLSKGGASGVLLEDSHPPGSQINALWGKDFQGMIHTIWPMGFGIKDGDGQYGAFNPIMGMPEVLNPGMYRQYEDWEGYLPLAEHSRRVSSDRWAHFDGSGNSFFSTVHSIIAKAGSLMTIGRISGGYAPWLGTYSSVVNSASGMKMMLFPLLGNNIWYQPCAKSLKASGVYPPDTVIIPKKKDKGHVDPDLDQKSVDTSLVTPDVDARTPDVQHVSTRKR